MKYIKTPLLWALGVIIGVHLVIEIIGRMILDRENLSMNVEAYGAEEAARLVTQDLVRDLEKENLGWYGHRVMDVATSMFKK